MFVSTDITGPLSANMYAYCENNPVKNSDPNGEFFFATLGFCIGYVTGAVSAKLSGADKEQQKAIAEASAVGGAMAGAGVDLGLLILGTGGGAAVALAAFGVAYVAGGIGSMYTTNETSKIVSGESANGDQMLSSFIIGGTFNLLSLATGLGKPVKCMIDLLDLGLSSFGNNLAVGTEIATFTTIAVEVGNRTAR